jgi:hypothetical protein
MKTGAERVKKWRAKPENRIKERLRSRERQNDPRVKARHILQGMNRNGSLEKEPCIICGSNKDIECHHPDYKKPKEYICLCASCHRKLHMEFKDEMRNKKAGLFY